MVQYVQVGHSAVWPYGHGSTSMERPDSVDPCLIELYCTTDTDSPFEVAMSCGHQQRFFDDMAKDGQQAMDKMLANINAEKTTATAYLMRCGRPWALPVSTPWSLSSCGNGSSR